MTNRSIWIVIVSYILILITYHRFENSEHTLQILGNIPTLLSSIATAGAFLIAAKTYLNSASQEKSKVAFTAYQESIENLIAILSKKEFDKSYKLYHSSLCFDAITRVETIVTAEEHKAILESKHIILKHHIEQLFLEYGVNDYFCSDKSSEKAIYYCMSKAADDLLNFLAK